VAVAPPLFQYIEVIDSCGVHYEGICVNLRSGPGVEYPAVTKLRTGIVLKVADTVTVDDKVWYKIQFDEGVRYPERVTGDWYVSADYVQLFTDEGDKVSYAGVAIENNKKIIIDISEQMLSAYDGDTLFMQEPISTGLEFTPTPRGTFVIYKKTPSRYMQGPVPDVSEDYYDLPGVPWDLYFTYGGAVIHGAYWHDNFGQPWSHGCVNLPSPKARELYLWADVGTLVTVRQ
jgi:lipoprotein-anchoring transpeptidase ErfK/SrfK